MEQVHHSCQLVPHFDQLDIVRIHAKGLLELTANLIQPARDMYTRKSRAPRDVVACVGRVVGAYELCGCAG